jgi:hypothetical protein
MPNQKYHLRVLWHDPNQLVGDHMPLEHVLGLALDELPAAPDPGAIGLVGASLYH